MAVKKVSKKIYKTDKRTYTVRKNKSKEEKAETIDFETFLKAITEAYPNMRGLAAGVSLAWLPDKQQWYASICKYESNMKQIVRAHYSAVSIQDAIVGLATEWKALMRPKSDNNLKNFLAD